MRAWALQDAESGLYLPWGKKLQNNSHVEFTSADMPRLFNSRRAAINARTAWREGKWRWYCSGEDSGDLGACPQEGRKEKQIVVVEFLLQEVL